MVSNMKNISTSKQSGAVSLFVVIFAMLIITVVTISFLRLMMVDQSQASDTDLSQSAYDSAQAGVEDAKRALLHYQQVCSSTPSLCAALASSLSSDVCNAAVLIDGVVPSSSVKGGTPSTPGEIMVQQSTSATDAILDQAYTCVTMKLATQDYVGQLSADDSQIVPLISESPYDTVTIRWFSRDDLADSTGALDLQNVVSGALLPEKTQAGWPTTRPSLMRAQLIQFGSSFKLDGFDYVKDSGGTTQSNANTVFLYPSSSAGASTIDSFTALDTRKDSPTDEPDADSPTNTPKTVRCLPNISGGGYACSMSLRLPEPIDGGGRTAFLRLTSLYNKSHFQVVLTNGGAPDTGGTNIIKFKDVQPEVDSTGRANDIFRRVQSRVNLYDTSFPYPDATIDITGNFCKDFGVTDSQYIAGSCTP
jgi:Tfp pilus assembly protein PilX